MYRIAFAFALCVIGPSIACAQWTVVNLHPTGANASIVNAVSGGRQAGSVTIGNSSHASMWSGSAASWVDLHPLGVGATSSELRAIGGTGGSRQGGSVSLNNGDSRASLWSGSAASWVNVHPAGVVFSDIRSISSDGGLQAGYIYTGSTYHAGLWNGTAASWVDLHPAGAIGSQASGVNGGRQAGFMYGAIPEQSHAGLWSGTAASWVDIHPLNASSSEVLAVSAGQQAGITRVGAYSASLWSGTRNSWVNLNPAGSFYSSATALIDGRQVGYARFDGISGFDHAGVWTGTADSFFDLHTLLPANFQMSHAQGIFSDGVTVSVVGYGFNTATNRMEALLWRRPVYCGADFNDDNVINFSDYLDFVAAFADRSLVADFNHDNIVDFFDYLDFVNAFSAGC